MELNRRIIMLLQFNGQLQKELAKAVGVNEATVSRWLHGRNKMSLTHLIKTADFLGVSLTELSGGSKKFDELLERYYNSPSLLK